MLVFEFVKKAIYKFNEDEAYFGVSFRIISGGNFNGLEISSWRLNIAILAKKGRIKAMILII